MSKLFDRYVGQVDPPSRYDFDDLTYDSAASTIRIYGGWNRAFQRFVIALFFAVAVFGLISILVGNPILGIINLLQGLIWGGWFLRTHIRDSKKIAMAKALQAEIVTKRATGQGSAHMTAFDNVGEKLDALAEKSKNLLNLDKSALVHMARMYKVPGRSRMTKEELVVALAQYNGLPTVYIHEPEYDTTSNEAGERHV